MSPSTHRTPEELAAARERLGELRGEIDALNTELLDLLERRAAIVLEIGAAKRTLGIAPFDPVREEAMLEELERRNPGPLDGEDVRAIFSAVFRACLAIQHRPREASPGAAGTPTNAPAHPEPTRP
jgi:3-deoxy-7-phosphoheptulonate synthase/chorismate mutase